LYRNLVSDLLAYGKITTTEAKAKEVQSLAEKMITLGKVGSLVSRRRVLAFTTNEKVVKKLFDEIAPMYAERPGGYTRIIKLGPRSGDNAPLVQLQLIK
jgi:large subunit ribosomal protein L17